MSASTASQFTLSIPLRTLLSHCFSTLDSKACYSNSKLYAIDILLHTVLMLAMFVTSITFMFGIIAKCHNARLVADTEKLLPMVPTSHSTTCVSLRTQHPRSHLLIQSGSLFLPASPASASMGMQACADGPSTSNVLLH